MAKDIHKVIGDHTRLAFEFRFAKRRQRTAPALWGSAQIYIDGKEVWQDPGGRGRPVEWDWFDLLEFLANHWPWLALEESYPIDLNPVYPAWMWEYAEHRWQHLDDSLAEYEEEELLKFQLRHDLSYSLKGAYTSSVWFLRQGNTMLVSVERMRKTVPVDFDYALAVLEHVGDLLSERARIIDSSNATQVLERWKARAGRALRYRLDLATGLPAETRSRLVDDSNEEEFWELQGDKYFEINEILAAARMSAGAVSIEVQRTILERLRSYSKTDTETLDRLARTFHQEFRPFGRPAFQGYWAAAWLRRKLDIEPESYADPRAVLDGWGVRIDETDLDTYEIAAISAWGRRHGPVVLLNRNAESRAGHLYGLRSTLAHELCHLLIDRNYSLPVAEVLGGKTPALVEQRARAFAAEFLVLRSVAQAILQKSVSVEDAVNRLVDTYRVSREIAAWQILNSDAKMTLSRHEMIELRTITSSARLQADEYGI